MSTTRIASALLLASALFAAPASRAGTDPYDVEATPVATTALNGKAVVVDVAVPEAWPAIEDVQAKLAQRVGVAVSVSPDGRRWRVLVPVDVEAAPGDRTLQLALRLQDGVRVDVERSVLIGAAQYETRELTVAKQFVKPPRKARLRARREAKAMERALAKRSPDRLWSGSFLRPVAGVDTSPFGAARTYNGKKKSRHMGLDMDGKVGDPIVATQRGRVVLAADRYYSGGTVVLDHGQGLYSMYFHMSRVDVKTGALVDKGAPLGAVGATGQVTGPHLHFAVKLSGVYVDPKDLLAVDLEPDDPVPEAP